MAISLQNVKQSTPHSKETEMMVLGCMLNSINALNLSADSLKIDDFYFKEHRLIFETQQEAYRNDRASDLHLLAEELKRKNLLNQIGGVAYLTELAQFATSSAYIEDYIAIVKDKAILRRMINAAQEIEKKALNDPKDIRATLDDAQALLFDIGQDSAQRFGVSVKQILTGAADQVEKPYLKDLQERQEWFQQKGPQEPGITGVKTHFTDLDKMINGLGPSNLIILAARPAMGKTALAINIAQQVSLKEKVPVGVFSLEMSADQLVHRMVCSQSEVESDKIRSGAIDGFEYQRIVSAVHELKEQTVIIDDHPGLKITDLRARARRLKESYGIGLIVIDYLQLISGSGSSRTMESRQNEISEISRLLKTLARELNVPIICLSQLSRRVEERTGHRPMMSDLRESGSIEQDADVVLFLLRREYYDPLDKPGMAELIVAKNRHGAVGSVNLTYRKEFAQFVNYSPVQISTAQVDEVANSAFSEFTPA